MSLIGCTSVIQSCNETVHSVYMSLNFQLINASRAVTGQLADATGDFA